MQSAARIRRYTGDRRSPSPSGRITLDIRVIIANIFGPVCGDDHPYITRYVRRFMVSSGLFVTVCNSWRGSERPSLRVLGSSRCRASLFCKLWSPVAPSPGIEVPSALPAWVYCRPGVRSLRAVLNLSANRFHNILEPTGSGPRAWRPPARRRGNRRAGSPDTGPSLPHMPMSGRYAFVHLCALAGYRQCRR